jgi:hypothetical protein
VEEREKEKEEEKEEQDEEEAETGMEEKRAGDESVSVRE